MRIYAIMINMEIKRDNHILTSSKMYFFIKKSIRYDIKRKKDIDTPSRYYFSSLCLRKARINFRQYEIAHLMENFVTW